MKKKFKITFDVSVEYPGLKKLTKRQQKQFTDWIKECVDVCSDDIIPPIYEYRKLGSIEYSGNAIIKGTIKEGSKTIHQTVLINQANEE